MNESPSKTRRSFLQLGLAGLACVVTIPAYAAIPHLGAGERRLAFHNLHTDEKLETTYWKDGQYDRAAWEKINHILRDHYSGDVYPMNLGLVDLVRDLQYRVQNDSPIEIISGYRSPQTNMRLASASHGVARNSFHMKGMAMDLRMEGTPLSKIHMAALTMQRGGVGYYPDSQFVHVDVGNVRRW